MYPAKYWLLVLAFPLVFASVAANGSVCKTPNGETATCVSIESCKVIKQAIAYLDKDAIEFAQKSQCGYQDGLPLVCCGSAGKPTTVAPHQPEPITQKPSKPDPDFEPVSSSFLPDQTLCGIQSKGDRIFGGKITDIDEFPWIVALKYTKEEDGTFGGFRCTGSLINQRYILTAAQCLNISGYNLTQVRLGEWRISTERDCVVNTDDNTCSEPVVDLDIVEKILHPFYTKRNGNNDIALLRVGKRIKYSPFIRPICLPSIDNPTPEPGTVMSVAGWGVTENDSQSDIKLKVEISVVPNSECLKVFPSYVHINPNQACAGGDLNKDACNGDSGGPLMRMYKYSGEEEEEQWYQEGIVYKGLGCGRKGVPALYTRVSRYVGWILNNLQYT